MEFVKDEIDSFEKFMIFFQNLPEFIKIVKDYVSKFEWMFQQDEDPWKNNNAYKYQDKNVHFSPFDDADAIPIELAYLLHTKVITIQGMKRFFFKKYKCMFIGIFYIKLIISISFENIFLIIFFI